MPLILNGTTGVSGVDGSAGTPSYQGTDTNTGVFFPAADVIAFSTSGTEDARFDSSGNLGIGTTSPGQKLDVRGDARFGANARIQLTESAGDAIIGGTAGTNFTAFTVNNTERMRIDSSGNVGIGTSSPSFGLVVQKDNGSGYVAGFRSAAGSPMLTIQNTGGISQIQGLNSALSATADIALQVSGGNVGIGTSSPNERLMVAGAIRATSNAANFAASDGALIDYFSGDMRIVAARSGANSSNMTFTTYSSGTANERMRITSGGELLVGKTASNYATAGCQLNNNGEILATRNGVCLSINRLSTDGDSLQFYQASSLAGAIGTNGGSPTRLFIVSGDTGIDFESSTDAIRPCSGSGGGRDNAIDLGRSDVRFKTAYITNGVVTGSDLNDKQDIEELTDAETRVAIACKGLLRKWRWKDSVVKKGDDARIHFGIIAQDLKAAFEAEGLDAGRYSMFVWNEWWESTEIYKDSNGIEKTRINTYQKQEDAPEGAVRKERMGIRYNELLAFMIAAI